MLQLIVVELLYLVLNTGPSILYKLLVGYCQDTTSVDWPLLTTLQLLASGKPIPLVHPTIYLLRKLHAQLEAPAFSR